MLKDPTIDTLIQSVNIPSDSSNSLGFLSSIWSHTCEFFSSYVWIDENLERAIASLSMLYLILYFYRPKVKIAECIASKDENGVTWYSFKVVNKGFHKIYDLRTEVAIYVPYPMGNGKFNYTTQVLDLKRTEFFSLDGKSLFKNHGENAWVIKTKYDLQGTMSGDSTLLRIEVAARHGLSGLTKVFCKEFNSSSKIKQGKFQFGNKMKVE